MDRLAAASALEKRAADLEAYDRYDIAPKYREMAAIVRASGKYSAAASVHLELGGHTVSGGDRSDRMVIADGICAEQRLRKQAEVAEAAAVVARAAAVTELASVRHGIAKECSHMTPASVSAETHAHAQGQAIRIKVVDTTTIKTPGWVQLDVASLDVTVEHLKVLFSDVCGTHPGLQRLIYKGKLLEDSRTLLQHGLDDGSTVFYQYDYRAE
jgi:hypothetical protein